jgi:hypothetical protein
LVDSDGALFENKPQKALLAFAWHPPSIQGNLRLKRLPLWHNGRSNFESPFVKARNNRINTRQHMRGAVVDDFVVVVQQIRDSALNTTPAFAR